MAKLFQPLRAQRETLEFESLSRSAATPITLPLNKSRRQLMSAREIGKVLGMRVPIFEALVNYTQGKLDIPPFAPRWGSNIMSTTTLAAAVARALNNLAAIGGRAIPLGDENWMMAEYWGMFFKAAGSNVKIEASHKNHPLLPRSFIFAGRDKVVRCRLIGGLSPTPC
ncbi:hypothetical protein CDV31_007656 [Fusarium ambrosium]|uniref:Uncharacterized protein n=1 Tax=Fusarium ambrosium TaxID=131363 RepID=A0A428U5H2_9HYPO|nr:hypothetical protein CDV31_007656 [Fusarium ambrosium]